MVALQPAIANRDIGKDILKRLQHSETRTKDWNHHQLAGQNSADGRHERRVDEFLDRFQITGRLQREQQSELITQIPEKHGLRRLVAQVGDDVLGQRMVQKMKCRWLRIRKPSRLGNESFYSRQTAEKGQA